MNTPIYDFVKHYSLSGISRFHMPGHKGVPFLGCEPFDITEVAGADVLYSPTGIIAESEANATALFGTHHTFYSTEGSTLAIKAMIGIATSGSADERPTILAARNVHKSFVHACALLDVDVEWLISDTRTHLCSCNVSAADLERTIAALSKKPQAVYVTSPDYLGNILDISALAEVCHNHEIPLLVDNAHGAYLAFLEPSLHPIALGADACCDSAHKTLPVLTGGAYLHISKNAPHHFKQELSVRNTLSVFASTSPSYLILQSLDLCNRYLSDNYPLRLAEHIGLLDGLKNRLREIGYTLLPSEPLKTVIDCNSYGYKGWELAAHLRRAGIECEFADDEVLVLMSTPENSRSDVELLWNTLSSIKMMPPIDGPHKGFLAHPPKRRLSIRRAVFSPRQTVSVDDSLGRVCASTSVSCPPAVPITVSGEVIEEAHLQLFKAYGIDQIEVILQ